MDAVSTSETPVYFYETIRRNIKGNSSTHLELQPEISLHNLVGCSLFFPLSRRDTSARRSPAVTYSNNHDILPWTTTHCVGYYAMMHEKVAEQSTEK